MAWRVRATCSTWARVSFQPFTGVKPEVLLDAMGRYYPDALRGRQIDPRVRAIAQCISFVYREGEGLPALHMAPALHQVEVVEQLHLPGLGGQLRAAERPYRPRPVARAALPVCPV